VYRLRRSAAGGRGLAGERTPNGINLKMINIGVLIILTILSISGVKSLHD
jgi:hypothetical protein